MGCRKGSNRGLKRGAEGGTKNRGYSRFSLENNETNKIIGLYNESAPILLIEKMALCCSGLFTLMHIIYKMSMLTLVRITGSYSYTQVRNATVSMTMANSEYSQLSPDLGCNLLKRQHFPPPDRVSCGQLCDQECGKLSVLLLLSLFHLHL